MILFTLDTKYLKKQSIVYIFITIFCYIFAKVYELYSHGVYSAFMSNAYLIPLIFGAIVSLIQSVSGKTKIYNRVSVNLYNASIATFTVYSILRGVLEIYGTTNSLINVYVYVGIVLLVTSILPCVHIEKKD